MNTIRVLSERILRILNGGNFINDSKFNEQDIHYLVRDTVAKINKGEWYSERNEGGKRIDDRYVITFDGQEVKVDPLTAENYIDLPVKSYMRLPDGAGIHSVRPDKSGTNTKRTKNLEYRAFIPIPSRYEDIFFQLPAGSLENMYGWQLRKDKIYFTKKDDQTLLEYDISKVSVDVVSVDPAAVSLDDGLPLSAEAAQVVIAEVVQILKGGAPQVVDVINDNNPNVTKAE